MAHNTPIQEKFNGRWLVAALLLLMGSTTAAVAAKLTYSVHAGPNGYAPFIIVEKKGDEFISTGFIHEFLDAFDKSNAGYRRKSVLLTRKRANVAMSEGQAFDLMLNSPLFVSDEILRHYQFTIPVLKSSDVVITRKDQEIDYRSPKDLYKKSVGIIRGYGYGDFDALLADGVIKGVPVDHHKQAIGMLHRERIDAYFGNIHVSPWYMKQMNLEVSDFEMAAVPLYEFEFGFLISKRKPELLTQLNAFIRKSTADGTIDALAEKFLN